MIGRRWVCALAGGNAAARTAPAGAGTAVEMWVVAFTSYSTDPPDFPWSFLGFSNAGIRWSDGLPRGADYADPRANAPSPETWD